ncbi:hypothetical protein SHIRM173S_07121 [Streptomyces hirsutus]
MCPTVRDAQWADRAAASGPDTRPVLRPEQRAADPEPDRSGGLEEGGQSHHTYLPRSPSRVSGCHPHTSAQARTNARPRPDSHSSRSNGTGGSGGSGSASHAPIRSSCALKVPAQLTLTFPVTAFAPFLEALKESAR